MDVHAYLDRIGYQGSLEPNADTLAALQRAHLLAAPFENLDIGRGQPIVLDHALLFDKIVARRRGGFCYELNGLFAELLRALGFGVTRLAAGVARADGGFGPEFDHLTLLVREVGDGAWEMRDDRPQSPIPNSHPPTPTLWLVDVGFGDSFRAPLRLVAGLEQPQAGRAYRLDRDGERWTLWERAKEGWQPQYRFTLQPREFAEYAGMCLYHQTSPESSFTRKRVCSLATPGGRITLSNSQLIVTEGDTRTEHALADEDQVRAVLRERFGIVLD
jgi:N-hydroxyarylamine O-acetyltransferase